MYQIPAHKSCKNTIGKIIILWYFYCDLWNLIIFIMNFMNLNSSLTITNFQFEFKYNHMILYLVKTIYQMCVWFGVKNSIYILMFEF
jgi:hypothetical protein